MSVKIDQVNACVYVSHMVMYCSAGTAAQIPVLVHTELQAIKSLPCAHGLHISVKNIFVGSKNKVLMKLHNNFLNKRKQMRFRMISDSEFEQFGVFCCFIFLKTKDRTVCRKLD